MHKQLELPYYYCAENQNYFLQLCEQELILFRRSQRSSWSEKTIIFSSCLYFHAAPDREGILHILAADDNNNLCYLLADENNVWKAPFFVKKSHAPFLFTFSATGHAYFCGNHAGRLIEAVFSAEHGWSERKGNVKPKQFFCAAPFLKTKLKSRRCKKKIYEQEIEAAHGESFLEKFTYIIPKKPSRKD
ncbi:MAG: hypothetical protein AAGT88_01305 [Dethiobacter sp.]